MSNETKTPIQGYEEAHGINDIVDRVAGRVAQTDILKDSVELENEPINPDENYVPAEELMTKEQLEKAEQYKVAMAEKYGVSPEDFINVHTTEQWNGPERDLFHVIYAAPKPLDKGSWVDINPRVGLGRDFKVEVDGDKKDTRKLTRSEYAAMVDALKAEGRPLPDADGQTETFLTGESSQPYGTTSQLLFRTNEHSKTAHVDDDGTLVFTEGRKVRAGADNGYKMAGFRPSLTIMPDINS